MFCKQCGTQIKDAERVCPGCGFKIANKKASGNMPTCYRCGALLKAGVNYCKHCGAPTGTAPSESVSRCICGDVLRPNADFCKKCGTPTRRHIPVVTIPIDESEKVTSISISDTMPPTESSAGKLSIEKSNTRTTASPVDNNPVPAKATSGKKKPGIASMSKLAQAGGAQLPFIATKVASDTVAAQSVAGEYALPTELSSPSILTITTKTQRLSSLLGDSIKSIFINMGDIFKNKRKLLPLLILSSIWLILSFLSVKGVNSRFLDLLFKATAAGGSLLGGSIVKCFVAALVCSLFGESGFAKKLFAGAGQLLASFGKGKGSFGGMLLGLGSALLLCQILGVTRITDAVLPISGFLLAVKSLSGNGHIRRIAEFLLPRGVPAATSLLAGWGLGFLPAIPASRFALLGGCICVISGLIFSFLRRNGKEIKKV